MKWETFTLASYPGSKWVKTLVEIRRNSDGLVRSEIHDCIFSEDENGPSLFIWSEGNFSCDCNRGLFFSQIVNEPDPDHECGESLYSVRIRHPETKQIVFQDGQWPIIH